MQPHPCGSHSWTLQYSIPEQCYQPTADCLTGELTRQGAVQGESVQIPQLDGFVRGGGGQLAHIGAQHAFQYVACAWGGISRGSACISGRSLHMGWYKQRWVGQGGDRRQTFGPAGARRSNQPLQHPITCSLNTHPGARAACAATHPVYAHFTTRRPQPALTRSPSAVCLQPFPLLTLVRSQLVQRLKVCGEVGAAHGAPHVARAAAGSSGGRQTASCEKGCG